MSYILYRDRPTAIQSYNSFRISSKIAENAQGSYRKAEQILAKSYWKALVTAAGNNQAVPILPPANQMWTWNRSFEIALDIAIQYDDDEIMLLVPESAAVIIGDDVNDVTDEEKREMLADLDFLKDNPEQEYNEQQQAKIRERAQARLKTPWQQEKEDIENIIANVHLTFGAFVAKALEVYNISASDLAKMANLTTSAVARLRDGEIQIPSKSMALGIGLALGLERVELEKMLISAGYYLSPSVPRDMIVKYYIEKGETNVNKVNRVLFLNDIPLLGSHK